MANFLPLKNYILYCLDRLIDRQQLKPPFLDMACGIGDVSTHLAKQGWHGKAIDISEKAIIRARHNLAIFNNVSVEQKDLFSETNSFSTILALDILEHVEDDLALLRKICSLLEDDGFLVMTVPSNPREWRWDDDFYGHFRRYTVDEVKQKLRAANLQPLLFWDCTYPFFWLMRRAYTRLKRKPKDFHTNKLERTQQSAVTNSWYIPFVSSVMSYDLIFWRPLYFVMFKHFKNKIENGHEILVLARKISE